MHNKLIEPNGLELLLIKHGNRTLLGQTRWVQDIDAYRRRDQERPARDARVGMLPPKLAQIILNLAVGTSVRDSLNTSLKANVDPSLKFNEEPASNNKPYDQQSLVRSQPNNPLHILDPFCGTGVVLQEALLQGYFAAGADLDQRMVDYSLQNIKWLHETIGYPGTLLNIVPADATKDQWKIPLDSIACETYLGRPFSAAPEPATLQKVIHDVDTIHKKFLQNVAGHPNVKDEARHGRKFRICLAVPAWKTKTGFQHLPILDHLEELGYNRVRFVHAKTSELIYHREGQFVARELVVLTKS